MTKAVDFDKAEVSLLEAAVADLNAWLETYRNLTDGSKLVLSARNKIRRRLEEVKS